MLGKLLKYEFKATSRMLIPLYGAVIIFALINKIFIGDFLTTKNTFLGNIPQIIAMMMYVTTLIATFVVTLFIIIQRFRTNLLGDEGYLMNTIPVKPWQNIASKLIVSCVWSILSLICAIISIFILAYQKGLFSSIFQGLPQLFKAFSENFGFEGYIFGLEGLLIFVLGGLSGILMIYASLSIGSLFSKRKILASFGAFLVLNIASNTIATVIQLPVIFIFEGKSNITSGDIHTLLIATLAISAILSVAYFFISNYILNKKLNLE